VQKRDAARKSPQLFVHLQCSFAQGLHSAW